MQNTCCTAEEKLVSVVESNCTYKESETVGEPVGVRVGCVVGPAVGVLVGCFVGLSVGCAVGWEVTGAPVSPFRVGVLVG